MLLNYSFHIDNAAKPLVISHNGASGDYPDCTDQAYQKAVDDGADVIDCPVQVTKDGIPICMSSIDLIDVTNVAKSEFASQTTTINDLKAGPGVFTFNLTWDDISKNLKRKSTRILSCSIGDSPSLPPCCICVFFLCKYLTKFLYIIRYMVLLNYYAVKLNK